MIADYYKILGVERNATIDDIKKAYRKLARATHPDTTHCGDAEDFRVIKEAYDTLRDSKKREQYDLQLVQHEQPVHRRKSYQPFHFVDSLFNYGWFDIDQRFTDVHESFSPALEIILTPEEAISGTEITLSLPLTIACQQCWGSGGSFLFPCNFCNGEGFLLTSHPMTLTIPPGTRDGSIFFVNSNIENRWLQIVIRIR